eukprot:8637334-Pyramimonas_sp.AAC.1
MAQQEQVRRFFLAPGPRVHVVLPGLVAEFTQTLWCARAVRCTRLWRCHFGSSNRKAFLRALLGG